ncbi:hypothetical protein SKAU_G00090940 [Synaphobranchus kaupii]|uniref:Uncharacterized protein n=1 Tax=Synaphobranchus kaupii TaxID=118154 RepID=A0A9Q1FXJ9_SYNKA|nr:hypothetical protein SKAU_G00090940 [Synaphobranchus kaupii]
MPAVLIARFVAWTGFLVPAYHCPSQIIAASILVSLSLCHSVCWSLLTFAPTASLSESAEVTCGDTVTLEPSVCPEFSLVTGPGRGSEELAPGQPTSAPAWQHQDSGASLPQDTRSHQPSPATYSDGTHEIQLQLRFETRSRESLCILPAENAPHMFAPLECSGMFRHLRSGTGHWFSPRG